MYKVNVYIYITAIYIFWLNSFTYQLKLRDSEILAKYILALLFINTKINYDLKLHRRSHNVTISIFIRYRFFSKSIFV